LITGGGGPSFLIVSLRYIGDVLLSTPLALSIRTHIPHAEVDYLVFEGTEGVLSKNPHVRTVLTIPPASRSLRRYGLLWKKYDYAVATNPSDRSAIQCIGAGRTTVGFSYFRRKEWWKKTLLDECRFYNDSVHIVPLILSLLEPLGIPPRPRVVAAFGESDAGFAREELGPGGYVLLHPYAGRRYKYWTPRGWGALAAVLTKTTGLRPVFTVSADPADRAVLEQILSCAPRGTAAFRRRFTLPQLAAAIHGAHGFVGVDTVATHMAAALDVPTVALYGPSMTRHWGPWPNDSSEQSPYPAHGGLRRIGKITVIQREWPCVPCSKETCALSGGNRMLCLEELSAEEVAEELFLVMGFPRAGEGA
jgi:heptosyltransferase-3